MIKNTLRIYLFLVILLYGGLHGDTLTVVCVGDIMMGSSYPSDNLPPDSGRHLFTDVAPVLRAADLTLGNLEGTLLAGGVCAKKVEKGRCYAFRTPPYFVNNLLEAGFDYLNLANNHMNDFGSGGITSTMNTLENAGLCYGGPQGRIGEFTVRGMSIAVISFATSPNAHTMFRIAEAQRIVAGHARTHDITIVSLHGGGEGLNYLHTRNTVEHFLGWPRGNVVQFARAVIDSGADLVWGHGPHVPRALEIYHDRLIAYSLGNFCTWGFNLDRALGFAPILEVAMDSSGVFLSGRIHSAVQRKYTNPRIDTLQQAARLMRELSEEDFPRSVLMISENGFMFRPYTKIIRPCIHRVQ